MHEVEWYREGIRISKIFRLYNRKVVEVEDFFDEKRNRLSASIQEKEGLP